MWSSYQIAQENEKTYKSISIVMKSSYFLLELYQIIRLCSFHPVKPNKPQTQGKLFPGLLMSVTVH